jgi:hypothetical protein
VVFRLFRTQALKEGTDCNRVFSPANPLGSVMGNEMRASPEGADQAISDQAKRKPWSPPRVIRSEIGGQTEKPNYFTEVSLPTSGPNPS